MLALIERLVESSPPGSIVVVEADSRSTFSPCRSADRWDVREYRPAIVGISAPGRLMTL